MGIRLRVVTAILVDRASQADGSIRGSGKARRVSTSRQRTQSKKKVGSRRAAIKSGGDTNIS